MSFDPFDEEPPVTVTVDKVLHVTDKAAFCRIDGGDYWIPFSEMDPESEILCGGDPDEMKGRSGDLTIPAWLARAKDLG